MLCYFDSCQYALAMMSRETTSVSTSDTGMEYSTPSRPNQMGSSRAKPTPNRISRIMDSAVDYTALPMACRKMKAALLTQANTTMHR